ncbi:TfoX/Sxy family protein [Ekhidna sp.]|uniref:TfoX/Sxy family protein n=1 Tax=Ekhidna sp. TaxID=2608089 RepID=UPI0032986E44
MGQKGDKHSNEAQLTAELFLEKLSLIQGVTSKKMFGGHGFFHEGQMFGMVDSKGKIALKATGDLEQEYLKIGSSKHGKMPYYSVPENIFQSDELIDWVKKSIALNS